MVAPTKQDGTNATIPSTPENSGIMTLVNDAMDFTMGYKNNIRLMGPISKMKQPNGMFTENDYVWRPIQQNLNINRDMIRMMEIIEYQPTKFYDWVDGARKYLNRIVSVGVTAKETFLGGFNTLGALWDDLGPRVFIPGVGLGAVVADPGYYYRHYAIGRGVKGILNLPMEEVVNYFATNPVCRYVIPFTGQDYLSTDGSYGWNGKDENDRKRDNMGFGLGYLNKFMDAVGSFTPSTAMKMVNWNPTNFQTPEPVSTDFNLYNDNIVDLIKNIKFIYSLSSGAYWMSLASYHYSSNLYRIRCPNMFDYYYCGMSIEITELGNKRLLHPAGKALMIDQFGSEFLQDYFTHFPDGYSVKIQFKPLVPNNFNTYVNNLLKNNYEKQD